MPHGLCGYLVSKLVNQGGLDLGALSRKLCTSLSPTELQNQLKNLLIEARDRCLKAGLMLVSGMPSLPGQRELLRFWGNVLLESAGAAGLGECGLGASSSATL